MCISKTLTVGMDSCQNSHSQILYPDHLTFPLRMWTESVYSGRQFLLTVTKWFWRETPGRQFLLIDKMVLEGSIVVYVFIFYFSNILYPLLVNHVSTLRVYVFSRFGRLFFAVGKKLCLRN